MRQSQMRGQGNRSRTEGNRPYKKFKNWPKHSAPQGTYRGGMRRNQSVNISALHAPRPVAMSEGAGSVAPDRTTCATCGKEHRGRCLMGQNICYNYRQSGHFAKDCQQTPNSWVAPSASLPTVQMDKIGGGRFVGRGRAHGSISYQGAG